MASEFVARGRALAVAMVLTFVSSCGSPESKLRAACLDVLADRLRAPSTLNLVEASYRANPIVVSDEMRRAWEARLAQLDAQQSDSMRDEDVSESLDLMLKTGALRRAERGEAAPMRYEMTLKYDADNAFGTPIRGYARCRYESWSGDIPDALELYVELDGETQSRYLSRRLRELSN